MERMRSQITSLTTSREVKLQRLIELKEQKDKGKELDANCEQGLKLITAIHAEIEKERSVWKIIVLVMNFNQFSLSYQG